MVAQNPAPTVFPERDLAEDPLIQSLIQECLDAECLVHGVMYALPPAERDILSNYIGLRDELGYQAMKYIVESR